MCFKCQKRLHKLPNVVLFLSIIQTTLKLDNANRKLSEIEAREEPLNVLPFTPVSSTCSSGIGNLNSAEIHEQQDVKPKRSRNRQVAIKQPVSNPLESNPTKRQRIRNTRAKSSTKFQ